MAAVLNRTTRQYIASANTPDYPTASWIHNPDLSAVAGFDSRYWIITGDAVSLMTQAQRNAVDATLRDADREAQVQQQVDQVESVLRAVVLITMDEINILRAQAGLAARTISQLRTAIRNKLGS